MSKSKYDRQEFISDHLFAFGRIRRRNLMEAFSISIAQASLDLKAWIATNPDKILYDRVRKEYRPRNEPRETTERKERTLREAVTRVEADLRDGHMIHADITDYRIVVAAARQEYEKQRIVEFARKEHAKSEASR